MTKIFFYVALLTILTFLTPSFVLAGPSCGSIRDKAYTQVWLLPYVGSITNIDACSLRGPTEQETQELYSLCAGDLIRDCGMDEGQCRLSIDDSIDMYVSDQNCAKKNLITGVLPNGKKVAFNTGYNIDRILMDQFTRTGVAEGWLIKCANGQFSAPTSPKDRYKREMLSSCSSSGLVDSSYCEQTLNKLINDSTKYSCPKITPSTTIGVNQSATSPLPTTTSIQNKLQAFFQQIKNKRDFNLLDVIGISALVSIVSIFVYSKLINIKKKKGKK